MSDEYSLRRDARLTVVEELVCRVYAIVLADEHDPHRALIQFSEGLKEELCPSSDENTGSKDQISRLKHAIDHAVELIRTSIASGEPIPGCAEADDEL